MAGFVFRDNSAVVLKQISANSESAMAKAAELLVEAVQEKMLYGYHTSHGNPPHTEIVDTGTLFDSIEGRYQKASSNTYQAVVGTNTPYASYVHDGTYKLEGRPFIRDGVMDSRDKLRALLREELGNGFTT